MAWDISFLNDLGIEELEALKSTVNLHIDIEKKKERKETYNKTVKNILNEITAIIDKCFMGRQIAMTIKKDDYSGVENDINIDWDDLLNYLEDYLISERSR